MKKILILFCCIFSIHFISLGQLSQITDSSFQKGEINNMIKVGNDVYSYGEVGGVFKSSDSGKNWIYMSSTMDSSTNCIQDMIYFNNKFYVLLNMQNGTNRFVVSSDMCQSWQKANNMTGLPNRQYMAHGLGNANNLAFMYVRLYDQWGYGMDSSYIYYSSSGLSWTKGAYIGQNIDFRETCHINKNKLYFSIRVNDFDSLIYTSNGTSVYGIPTTGLDRSQYNLYSISGDLYSPNLYLGNNGDPFRFDSAQNKWINIRGTGINVNGSVDGVMGVDNMLFCYAIIMQGPSFIIEAYRSKNKGGIWQIIPTTSTFPPIPRALIAVSDSIYIMNTQLDDIIYSSDTGFTWKKPISGYQNKVVGSLTETNDVLITHNIVTGILKSVDKGASWYYSNSGLKQGMPGAYFIVETFTGGGKLFVSVESSPDAGDYQLSRSSNNGSSWTQITSLPSYKMMTYYGENGNSFIMRFSDDKDRNTSWDTNCFYYRTSDAGANWTNIGSDFFKSSAMNLSKVHGFTGDGNTLFLFGNTKNYSPIIYYSTNNGFNWNKVSSMNQNQQEIKVKDSWSRTARTQIAATNNNGKFIFVVSYRWSEDTFDSLYNLTSSGITPINTTGLPYGIIITDLNYMDGYWYLSSTQGLFASTNGANWQKANINNYYLGMNADNMVKIDDQLYLGTLGNGIWKFDHKKMKLASDLQICLGDSVVITADCPDSNFAWCCGYGNSKSIKIAPSSTINLTASSIDIFGFLSSDTLKITVHPLPVSDFNINDSTQCLSSNNFVFTGKSTISTGLMDYFWDFGDGNGISYNNNPNHTYATYSPFYDVKLINISDHGCMDSLVKRVYFEIPPIANITAAGDTAVCDGDSVSMYANTGTNLNYQWYKNNVLISGASNPYYATTTSGVYHVLVTDNLTGCSTESNSITIIINTTNLNPNFTGSPRDPSWNSGAQQFEKVYFTNMTLNPNDFNFSWLFGDGNINYDLDPSYNYKFNGLFTVSLTAEHKQTGCRDTFSRLDYIECVGGSVNPCPITVEITYSGIPIICKNDSFLITANTTGSISNYIWTHEGTVLIGENGSSIYAKTSGNYLVIVSDTNCSVASLPFTLNNYPIVEPIIQSEGSIKPCSLDSMRLYNTTYYSAYKWSTGESGTSIYVKESGEYFLTVTDIYGCKATSAPFSVNASLMQKPEICLVTVDTISKKNLIAWERTQSNMILGYNIYKEGFQANVYNLIGYLPYDSLSVFPDTSSIPQQRSNRYKISLIDTCNIESAPSDHHKTIHLSANTGTSGENNLIWSHYEGFPFSSYKIFRGTTPSNIILLDSVPSNLNSYSDLNPPSGLVFYQVNVVKYDTCYPSVFRAQTSKGPFSQSMSNLRDYNASQTDYLQVTQDTHTFDTSGGSFDFEVFTNLTSWNAVSDQSWLTVNVDVPNKKITATASKNTETTSRQAVITLSGAGVADVEILITQDGVVSISELSDTRLMVYPNPFDAYFYLYMPGTKGEKKIVSLHDMNGKTVFKQEYQGDELIKIDRNNLAHGMYYVRVMMDKTYLQKVVAY